MERSRHLQGVLIIMALVMLGGLYLWQNQQPSEKRSAPSPKSTHTPVPVPVLAHQTDGTMRPTVDLQATPIVIPTLPPTAEEAVVLVEPMEIPITPSLTLTPSAVEREPTAVISGPTPFPSPTVLIDIDSGEDLGFEPPPDEAPLSAHAYDHFYLERPVAANANSESLFNYPFGSDGPTNDWRVHHGVDIGNPVGEEIHAGGSGTIFFAGNAAEISGANPNDLYASYGNVVVIEHDFGYRGQKIFTLYAHMALILVEAGQRVQAGDVLGLIGDTGDVSGSHVHMEVRLGQNKYYSVHNPLLWIVPYVGHGVVAGRVTAPDGSLAEDVVITLSRRGRVAETTTSYIRAKKPGQVRDWDVVPDLAWQENFVFGDVPEGEYTISATVWGQRVEHDITVAAGTTNFITLGPEPAATPQPVEADNDVNR